MSDGSRTLPLVSRRKMIMGGAAFATSAAAYGLVPRRPEHDVARIRLGQLVPMTIGPWRFVSRGGVIVARDEVEGPADGYDQVVSRTYSASGQPDVMMMLAYGYTQGGGLQIHRPETCYPGQGFSLSQSLAESRDLAGRIVPIQRLTAIRDERIERLIYWTRVGQSFPLSTAGEYAAILSGAFAGVISDGILVRLSSIGPDFSRSDIALDGFLHAMVGALPDSARGIMLGDSPQAY